MTIHNKSELISYRSIIAYDGTLYRGWQSQKDGLSIANTIQKTIEKTFSCKTKIIGASRTDAGVHAYGQNALLYLPKLNFSNEHITKILNEHLPASIHVRKITPDTIFFPHIGVQEKIYYYHFSYKRPLPWLSHYITHYPFPCDHNIVVQALSYFIGTHDFASFATRCKEKNTIRTINECRIEEHKNYFRVIIKGKSFVHNMIRRMVGAALTCGSRNLSPETIKRILEEKNPAQNFLNAPPQGLILMHIQYEYDPECNIATDFYF